MHFDEMLKILGEFGLYQRIRVILLCLFAVLSAWHAMNMVFIGALPDFHCDLSHLLPNVSKQNASTKDLMQLLLPKGKECYQYAGHVKNFLFKYSNTSSQDEVLISNVTTRKIVPCEHGYEFSTEKYLSTITSEFNLVCDRKFWISTSKSVFFAGRLCGAFMFGQLSDKFGRRPMFFLGCLLLLVAGTGAALAPNIYVFLPMYFCQGAGHTGAFLVAFILSTELVGPSYRVWVSFIISMFYTIGVISIAGVAYFIREWRYLEAAITAPVLLIALYWWFLPESVRWLLSNNKDAEAEDVLQKAAKQNGVRLDAGTVEALKDDVTLKASRKYYVIDCLKTWRMAQISLNVWFNWAVNSLVYYGLNLNTENLAGSPYLNFCIAGAVEVPATLFCLVVLNKFGRRWPLILTLALAGVACILSGCMPTGRNEGLRIAVIVLAMTGKMAVSASYTIIYLMSAEIFPTVIRNSGMGVSSMSARVGGILAPLILDLKTLWQPLPLLVFGSLSLLAATLALLLPETAGKPLPQLLEDVRAGKTCANLLCCRKEEKANSDVELPTKT